MSAICLIDHQKFIRKAETRNQLMLLQSALDSLDHQLALGKRVIIPGHPVYDINDPILHALLAKLKEKSFKKVKIKSHVQQTYDQHVEFYIRVKK